MSNQYKLNKRVKDDKFTPEEIGKYILNLQISQTLFRLCVTDTETNRCLLIEDYSLDSILYPEQLIEQLSAIYDGHEVLQAGYWRSIRLAIKDIDFSLIPKSLFDQQYARDYLRINTGQDALRNQDVFYYTQKSTDAVSIFSADKKIIDWFRKQYPGKAITLVHHTTAFIEGILFNNRDTADKSVFIHVEKNFLTIVVKSAQKLEFCNSFYFSTSEDFIYFAMFVYHQLQLNPEQTPLTLFGEIAPDSSVYKKLYKYVRHIKFGDKPSTIRFCYKFDEVFDHRFFDLYSMHFCE